MLYIICTPIGNLNDFSVRSINILKDVDNIFAEDTRVASKLLKHFDIPKKTFQFHEHNEEIISTKIINLSGVRCFDCSFYPFFSLVHPTNR